MPYSGTETLVFSSNTGDTDTIFFLKKDTLLAYPEAQRLNGVQYEVVSIVCKHSDTWPPDGKHRYLENYFIELQKSKDGKARLDIGLAAKDAHFYRLQGPKVDSLEKEKTTILQTKQKLYTDIYIINGVDWLNFKQRSDFVAKVYWSKSEGLIRYDKQDSVYWELTKKYSP